MRAAKVRPSVFTLDTSELDQTAPTNSAQLKNGSEYKVRQKDVELSNELQEVLDELIGHIKPLLNRLQDNRVITQDTTLWTLNPEYTRFVLKQAQMAMKDTKENSQETQIYCMTVCLHALVSSVDILMQSGLEAAIGKYGRHDGNNCEIG